MSNLIEYSRTEKKRKLPVIAQNLEREKGGDLTQSYDKIHYTFKK